MAATTSLPPQINVVDIPAPGGPDALRHTQRPRPEPGPGEVLVEVIAAGVNGPDLAQRKGLYPPPPGAYDLPGLEVSGRIAALGADTPRWQIGDEITALTNGGGYAEYVTVPGGQCLPLPPGVTAIDAAGLPETYFTVWSNLFLGKDVPPGARLFVQGGAGGIGSAAVQLGAALGLEVFATAGGPEACAFVEDLGATRAIDYRTEDYLPILKEAGSADIILDILGGEHIDRHIKAARPDGRIYCLSFRQGSKAEIDMGGVMRKRLTITGSTLRPRPPAFKAATARDLEEKVWPLFAAGKLKTVTAEVFPLAEAAKAHQVLEAGGHRGKVLLTTGAAT